MRAITVRRHRANYRGLWIASHGRTFLALIDLPIAAGDRPPTAAEVIDAVQEISPGYGATSQTPVTVDESWREDVL